MRLWIPHLTEENERLSQHWRAALCQSAYRIICTLREWIPDCWRHPPRDGTPWRDCCPLCRAEAWEEFKQKLLCQDVTYFLCVNVAINGRLTRSLAFFFDYVSDEWRLNTCILQWRYLHKCLTVVHDQHKACVLYSQYYGLFIQSIWKVFCVNIVWLVYRSHPSKNIR